VTDTTQGVVHLGADQGRFALRRRRITYTVVSAVLTAIVAAAVVDAATTIGIYGPNTERVTAAGPDGLELRVRYGSVSRPALATPFDITVTRPGGFDGQQVTLAVHSEYLAMWDENGLDPAPAEETADATTTYWTFEPPDGDTLRVSFDGRIEPAAQTGERGSVAVVDDDGTLLARVEFETVVLP
jgi:hypothetical protein